MNKLKERIAAIFYKLGFSADALTLLGLAAALISGILSFYGKFFWAGGFLLLSGGLDLMDGAVARLSGKTGVFGGILDSSLDRYGDAFALGGLVLFYARIGNVLFAGLALSALVASFGVSYVRARAECATASCRVGFWERGERLVYLSFGLLTGNLAIALWVLGTAVHLTVLYRLAYAADPKPFQASFSGAPSPARFFTDTRRTSPFYAMKAAFWLGLLLVKLSA
jgi:phosphatidylglycerophosphate synthase